jgi:hypothetical protein
LTSICLTGSRVAVGRFFRASAGAGAAVSIAFPFGVAPIKGHARPFQQPVDNPSFGYLTEFVRYSSVKTIGTEHHRALVRLLIRKRRGANLRQRDVAKRLREYQSWIARIESGQRRIDVVEFFALARVIGFDPYKALNKIFR